MKKCIVIGGGFAGLTAASYLSSKGISITLLEASPKLGGRAYSFNDVETNSVVDNGQHILMGCYNETLNFLKLIEANKNFSFQKRLKVNFLNEDGRLFKLEAAKIFYPFNILAGLMKFKTLEFIDRLRLLKFFLKLFFYSNEELKKLSLHQWLVLEGQNETIRKSFWDILAIGALNTSTKRASAKMFSDILKQMFFTGNRAATIILPSKGLSECYCEEARNFIEQRSGVIILSEQVLDFEIRDNRITKVITSKRTLADFDYVISTIPWLALEKIRDYKTEIINAENNSGKFLPDLFLNYEHSSILTLHIWLTKNKLTEKFYGLIDSPVQWIFNHADHLTLVTSDANDLIEKSKEELFELAAGELKKYAGIEKNDIKSYRVIKEKRATFIPSNEILEKRPSTKTKYKNFFLAGDWINTGLPSTIESAVMSGRMAAENLLEFN